MKITYLKGPSMQYDKSEMTISDTRKMYEKQDAMCQSITKMVDDIKLKLNGKKQRPRLWEILNYRIELRHLKQVLKRLRMKSGG